MMNAPHACDEAVAGQVDSSTGDWLEYAHWIEQAGANALELNVYYVPAQTRIAGHDVARNLAEHGAQGIVLFNRFYQPDIDLEMMQAAFIRTRTC